MYTSTVYLCMWAERVGGTHARGAGLQTLPERLHVHAVAVIPSVLEPSMVRTIELT